MKLLSQLKFWKKYLILRMNQQYKTCSSLIPEIIVYYIEGNLKTRYNNNKLVNVNSHLVNKPCPDFEKIRFILWSPWQIIEAAKFRLEYQVSNFLPRKKCGRVRILQRPCSATPVTQLPQLDNLPKLRRDVKSRSTRPRRTDQPDYSARLPMDG